MTDAKTLTKKELISLYAVNRQTFKKWCMHAKLFTEDYYRSIRVFQPAEVKKIFEKFGEP